LTACEKMILWPNLGLSSFRRRSLVCWWFLSETSVRGLATVIRFSRDIFQRYFRFFEALVRHTSDHYAVQFLFQLSEYTV
jgi:hypothetical protein